MTVDYNDTITILKSHAVCGALEVLTIVDNNKLRKPVVTDPILTGKVCPYCGKESELIDSVEVYGQYPALQRIMREDYETYSANILERYFKARLVESHDYRDIGGWWDPRGYIDEQGNRQQCEIDIVAVPMRGNKLEIYEVKRNPEIFKAGLLQEKVNHLTTKEREAKGKKTVLGCLSLMDM